MSSQDFSFLDDRIAAVMSGLYTFPPAARFASPASVQPFGNITSPWEGELAEDVENVQEKIVDQQAWIDSPIKDSVEMVCDELDSKIQQAMLGLSTTIEFTSPEAQATDSVVVPDPLPALGMKGDDKQPEAGQGQQRVLN